MTDRELLELAAKAAGYTVDVLMPTCGDLVLWNEKGGHTAWNPLTDDGDALRMAVKLSIHVLRFSNMTTARAIFSDHCFDERDDINAYAATRRAIVRSAAEIGKAME